MRAIGTVRPGDVVILEIHPEATDEDYDRIGGQLGDLNDATGVRFVVLGPLLRCCSTSPRARLRVRTGPTPRWCRR